MKFKTHQAMAKRIKISANHKLLRKPAAVSHLRVNKSARHTAVLLVNPSNLRRVKKMIGQ